MRLLNILVIAALVLAASFVYKIKFDSTLQAERIAKLRGEVRRERELTARLRAEWARLEAPQRVQDLAARHLKMAPMQSTQFDSLDNLPARPVPPQPGQDPIASIIAPNGAPGAAAAQSSAAAREATGSIRKPGVSR